MAAATSRDVHVQRKYQSDTIIESRIIIHRRERNIWYVFRRPLDVLEGEMY